MHLSHEIYPLLDPWLEEGRGLPENSENTRSFSPRLPKNIRLKPVELKFTLFNSLDLPLLIYLNRGGEIRPHAMTHRQLGCSMIHNLFKFLFRHCPISIHIKQFECNLPMKLGGLMSARGVKERMGTSKKGQKHNIFRKTNQSIYIIRSHYQGVMYLHSYPHIERIIPQRGRKRVHVHIPC